MTVGVTQAVRIGARAVACASTGNTSASLAAYAAQAGLPALVLVPAGNVAHRQAGAVARLRRADAPGPRRLRRLSPAGARRRATRLGVYLLNSINPFRLEGQKTIVLELLQQLAWESAGLDRAAGGQPGQHRGVREGAAGGARVGTDRPDAPARRGAGGGRGAVRAQLRGGLRARATGSSAETVATAIRIGDPASLRPRGARDPRDRRRGPRGERRRDPRGEGRGRRQRGGLRAGERRERRGRAGAGAAGDHRARCARRGGAHRATCSRIPASCSSTISRRIRRRPEPIAQWRSRRICGRWSECFPRA